MTRHLKIFVSISVLLNLLFAGILLGYSGWHLINGQQHLWEEMAASLPSDQRVHVEKAMDVVQNDTVEIRQQIDKARAKQAALLKTEPFDQTAYLVQAKEVQQLRNQIQQRRTETIATLAVNMTPEDRLAMAEVLLNSHRY